MQGCPCVSRPLVGPGIGRRLPSLSANDPVNHPGAGIGTKVPINAALSGRWPPINQCAREDREPEALVLARAGTVLRFGFGETRILFISAREVLYSGLRLFAAMIA